MKLHIDIKFLLIVITIFLLSLLAFVKEGFIPSLGGLKNPADVPFSDESLRTDKIKNAPSPAGAYITEKLIYSPVDLASDITKLRNDLSKIVYEQPIQISQQISQQSPVIVGNILESKINCPMIGNKYASSSVSSS